MKMILRRQLLYFLIIFTFCSSISPLKSMAFADDQSNDQKFPITIKIIEEAHWSETIAHEHYEAFSKKALSENYSNIAYLFSALSISEKIHAENYQKVINSLGASLGYKEFSISVDSTKKNLNLAATKELEKIDIFYPNILRKLGPESHDQAIINCMYSWKSHQQHEEMITDIKRYSGWFFGPLSKKIEKMNPNYFVCEICGSTIDEKPKTPCTICNYPMSHFKNLKRPI